MANHRISRRQFSKQLAAAAAGMAAIGASCAQEPKPQQRPGSTGNALEEIEKQRSAPLTPEQKKSFETNYNELKQMLEAIRKFPVKETAEPQLIFQPMPRNQVLEQRK